MKVFKNIKTSYRSIGTAQRIVALILVFTFVLSVPMEAQAYVDLGALFGGGEQEEETITRNAESLERDSEAERARALLQSNGEGVMTKCRLATAKTLAVAMSEKIEAYDTLSIGRTKLVFIPFCGEFFSWDDSSKKS